MYFDFGVLEIQFCRLRTDQIPHSVGNRQCLLFTHMLMPHFHNTCRKNANDSMKNPQRIIADVSKIKVSQDFLDFVPILFGSEPVLDSWEPQKKF